jgi:hypothetical protein
MRHPAMPKLKELRFKIDGFTPLTLPMARLAEYLKDLSALLGNDEFVHFIKVAKGSAALVHVIDEPEAPKVKERIMLAKSDNPPADVWRAYTALNEKLKADHVKGRILDDTGARLLEFPGVKTEQPVTYGPFSQQGTIEGVLIKIGGRDETVPVHIEDGTRSYTLNASREMARKLAPHLFGKPIRLHGMGRWYRDEDGTWELQWFNISSFEELDDDALPVVINRLREIQGNNWESVKDPLAELGRLRRGPKVQ